MKMSETANTPAYFDKSANMKNVTLHQVNATKQFYLKLTLQIIRLECL